MMNGSKATMLQEELVMKAENAKKISLPDMVNKQVSTDERLERFKIIASWKQTH
jgi:hypothetical protein